MAPASLTVRQCLAHAVHTPNERTTVTHADTNPSATEVHIRVSHDDDASRIAAVLEALGYRVMRELDEGDAPQRLAWAVTRLAQRHKLTAREQDILALVLDGLGNEQVGRKLEISRATVKWHMHNLFAKTNTGNRESLLRLALQLGSSAGSVASAVAATPPPTPEAAPAPKSMLAATPAKPPASSISVSPRPVVQHGEAHWAAAEDTSSRFDQPRVLSADAVPSKSWY